MPRFPDGVGELLARCSGTGLSAQQRGSALEKLIAEVFATVPGVEVRARNAKSVFDNEELDLVMTNRGGVDGLPALGPYFSVECKNWSRPVGSTEVSWFATKLRRSGQRFGVLVAAKGVTGRPQELTAAHFEAASALTEGQAVVVLTLAELGWLDSGEALADLLTEKHARLVARRELHIQQGPARPFPLPRPVRAASMSSARQVVLRAMAEAVRHDPDRVRSLDVALTSYRVARDAFAASENQEVDANGDERWIEENMIAFEQLEQALERIGQACIAALRRRPGPAWTVEYLALGVEMRAPHNLEAPPDSELADLLIAHWRRVLTDGPTFEHDAALLCLLGWAIEWRSAMETDHWPPSMV